MYPMKLKPVYDKTIWANDRLTTMRGMEEKGLGTCWEISAHPHAKNVILNGEYAGKTLDELIQADPQSILGEKQLHQMLRLAYLDAREDLSIQVHPYDEYARAHENDEGKTESWYILEADKGATLVAGTTASDAAVIKAAVENDQVEDYVRKVEVEAAEIYIFDDTFSALDFKTDARLRKALNELCQETRSTVLLVAQRISSIMHAQRIVVLDKGQVAGIGTHEELMKSCDVYKEIAYSQLSKEELENE